MQPNPYYPPPPPLPPARPDRTRLWLTIIAVLIAVGIIGLTVEIIVLTRDDSSSSSSTHTPTADENNAAAIKICQEGVAAELKDPSSAQFRGVTSTIVEGYTDNWTVEGQVNGKNSYGGYTGYTDFRCAAIRNADGTWHSGTVYIQPTYN